jgi:hypothetical protein
MQSRRQAIPDLVFFVFFLFIAVHKESNFKKEITII